MKRILVTILSFVFSLTALNAFTLSFVVSLGNGNFQTSDFTPTNDIDVTVITFNSFTPVEGAITFEDIINNSTTLASGTTDSDFLTNVGTLSITQSDITGNQGNELYVFANFGNSEFGLWRDLTGGTSWFGGDDDNLTTVTLTPFDTITAFAGTFDSGSFVLEVVPEPSTYALMALGGLVLIVGYGRKKK